MERKKVLVNTTEIFLNNMLFHGASSAAVMIYQAGSLQYYESTSNKWHDFYSEAKEAANCHIAQAGIRLAREKKSFSLIWDATKANNDASIYLNEQRERYNHCHGISICESLPNDTLFGIILTGRRCDINFADMVIKHKAKMAAEISNLKHSAGFYHQYKK